MESLWQDLRFSARMLLKQPGFALIAVLTLGLGIGANTAVFSVVDAMLLKMLPVRAPEELVLLRWLGGSGMRRGFSGSIEPDAATGLQTSTSMSYPAFERFRDQNQTLASLFAFAPAGQLNVIANGQAEMARGQLVTGGYFAGLGVQAALGRMLIEDDDKPGAEPAVVVSHRYWQRRFNRDPAAVGRVIHVNNTAFTIVGVTPPEFFGTLQLGAAPDVTIPMSFQPQIIPIDSERLRSATHWWLQMMGRLKPRVSAAQAQADLSTIWRRHALEFDGSLGEVVAPQLRLDSGSQGLMELRRTYSKPLSVLAAVTGLVLLIACLNIANLLLARAAGRGAEIAIRLSVGASRWRLIRQLLTESLLLASMGGLLGLLLAYWSKDVLVALLAAGRDGFVVDPRLDWRVLLFSAALSILTGVLFGLSPAFRATRVELSSMLKEGASTTSRARWRLGKALIVVQVALSLQLLIGAGLFAQTLRNLSRIEVGFNRENLLIFRVQPRMAGYETGRLPAFYEQMFERLAAIPGVRAVTASRDPLVGGGYSTTDIHVPDYTPRPDGEDMNAGKAVVAGNFFAAMEIPLLMGRDLSPRDNAQSPAVAVVNQTLARRFFADRNPLGRRIEMDGQEVEIVGVARDAKYGGIRDETAPVVFLPYLQSRSWPHPDLSFAVRAAGDPAAIIAGIHQAMRSLDPNVPLSEIRTQNAMIARLFAEERLFAALSGFFALLALALVCVGLYGVMSFTVARRTHEIGLRMALGAQGRDVMRLIVGQGMKLVMLGLAIGLSGAVALTPWLKSLLFGVPVTDPATFLAVAALLCAVMLLACWIPARRATKVDPWIALRSE